MWLVLLVVGGSARSLLCVVITVAMALAHGGVVLCLRQQYADKGWPVNPGASNARDDPLQSWVSAAPTLSNESSTHPPTQSTDPPRGSLSHQSAWVTLT